MLVVAQFWVSAAVGLGKAACGMGSEHLIWLGQLHCLSWIGIFHSHMGSAGLLWVAGACPPSMGRCGIYWAGS